MGSGTEGDFVFFCFFVFFVFDEMGEMRWGR